MSWFGSARTPLTDAIDRATHEQHPLSDLALYLEICDMVNETESGAKDAARALRKRLTPKSSPNVLLKTLNVLEMCGKNCGRRFHAQISAADFVDALTQVGTTPSVAGVVREKTLELIQSWADAFRGDMGLQAMPLAYRALQAKGIEFPAQDLDQMAPIYTPVSDHPATSGLVPSQPAGASGGAAVAGGGAAATAASSTAQSQLDADAAMARRLAQEEEQEEQQRRRQQEQQGQQPGQPSAARRTEPAHYVVQHLAPGQRVEADERQQGKLRSDLEAVKGNVTVLSDMLTGLGDAERCQDNPLFDELAVTLEAMRERASQLVDQLTNEALVVEIIEVIETVNAVLERLATREDLDLSKPAPATATTPPATAGEQGPAGAFTTAPAATAMPFNPTFAGSAAVGVAAPATTYDADDHAGSPHVSAYAPPYAAATPPVATVQAQQPLHPQQHEPEGGLTAAQAAEIESLLSPSGAVGGQGGQGAAHPHEEFDMFANARQASFKDLMSNTAYAHEEDVYESEHGTSLASAVYQSARNPDAQLAPAASLQSQQPQPQPPAVSEPAPVIPVLAEQRPPAGKAMPDNAPFVPSFGLDEASVMATRPLSLDPPAASPGGVESFASLDPLEDLPGTSTVDADRPLIDLDTPPTSATAPQPSTFRGLPAGQVNERRQRQFEGAEDSLFGL